MHTLTKIGWDETFQIEHLDTVARVIEIQKNSYRLTDGQNDYLAHLSGKFSNEISSSIDVPAVGDWVEVEKIKAEQKAVIHRVLPRKSQFIRQAPGAKTAAQVAAANIDTIFIVMSLNQDFNIRRIERYVLAVYESGASPVIVLTKKDICSSLELERMLVQIETVAIGVPVIAISSLTGEGMEELAAHLSPGKTVALLGSSGVGKSTLVNALLQKKIQSTKDIRNSDSKGRHTTTHRELFMMPNGALLIDTPGMRELQLWEGEPAIDTAFQDIAMYARECRFNDCRHVNEPGCRVQEALLSGELSEKRFQSYLKLGRELAYEKRRQDQKMQLDEKKRWKYKQQYHKKSR